MSWIRKQVMSKKMQELLEAVAGKLRRLTDCLLKAFRFYKMLASLKSSLKCSFPLFVWNTRLQSAQVQIIIAFFAG